MDIKILEVSNISPPPGSVPTTSIPLTFFDLPWINVSRPVVVERLFFYDYYSHPSTQNLLPLFKHTLSLTLQHFFPYAATLICPPPPHKPYIRYTDDDGSDSVPLTVAESSADFHRVVANYARDVTLLHPFVPLLAPARVESDGSTRVSPLLALQITLFSGTGICIGATYNHAVADGSAFMKFINFWASLHRSGGGDFSSSSFDKKSLPCASGRDVIKEQYGLLEPFFLNIYWSFLQSSEGSTGNENAAAAAIKDKVRATFVIGRDHVERLKHFVSRKNRIDDPEQSHHVSTFVVTSAFMWVCLEKLRDFFSDDAEMFCYFGFAFDCRNIVVPGGPVNHFGNCLLPGVVKVKKIDVMGEDGIVMAARAIGSKVKELKVGAVANAMKLWEQFIEMFTSGYRYVSFAGSPNLRVYDTDFGWGRPRKVEVTHIDKDGAMSLAESKDEKGGIEVGVALSKNEMDQLICIFEESLKKLL